MLRVELAQLLLALRVPRLQGVRALEVADGRVAQRLPQPPPAEHARAAPEQEETVHAVPARMELEAPLPQHDVERVLVAPLEPLRVGHAQLQQRVAPLVAP